MRGSIALEALLISVIVTFFLVFAGKAVQIYGAKFIEDVDRIAWIRQSIYKIHSSVKMLETCEAGSMDTIDVYVPKDGQIEVHDKVIRGKISNANRNYPALKGEDYSYSVPVDVAFTNPLELTEGWKRVRIVKKVDGFEVSEVQEG